MFIHCRTHIEHDLKMTNNSTLIECCSSTDLNLVGKVTTGIVTCMAIFLNGFVFFVALFSKRLRKSGYNLTTISLSFTDFLTGVSIRPLISYMANDYTVSYDSCTVALAGYMTCVLASTFHVLIIGCLRYYAINKNNLTVFKFELRNAILVIIFTWFLALLTTSVSFLVLVRKDSSSILCNVNNIFKENYKLYFKIHSMILLSCDFVLIAMYIVVGFKLYAPHRLVRRVHPGPNIDVKPPSVTTRSNTEACNYNVSNSSLVTIREMAISKNDTEVVTGEGDDKHNHLPGRSLCVHHGQNGDIKFQTDFGPSNEYFQQPNTTTKKVKSNTKYLDGPDFKPICVFPVKTSKKSETSLKKGKEQSREESNTKSSIKAQNGSHSSGVKSDNSVDIKRLEVDTSNNEKFKTSNNFIYTIRNRNLKSLKTVSIIVLLHVVLNCPYYFCLLVEGFFDGQVSAVIRSTLFGIAILHSVFNPLVYVVTIPGFRQFIKDKVQTLNHYICKP